jgi:hypothetical protein
VRQIDDGPIGHGDGNGVGGNSEITKGGGALEKMAGRACVSNDVGVGVVGGTT